MEVELHVREATHSRTWAQWLAFTRYRFDLPDGLGARAVAAWKELAAVEKEIETYLGIADLDDAEAKRVLAAEGPRTAERRRYEDELRSALRAMAPAKAADSTPHR